MLDPPRLGGGVAGFLADQRFAGLTARAGSGQLWVSPLVGAPGVLSVQDAGTVRIRTAPGRSDPLHRLPAPQPVGLIALDYSRRRRVRINGALVSATTDGELRVDVTEAFGNCPQFIPRRTIDAGAEEPGHPQDDPGDHTAPDETLTEIDRATIESADTFVLGTTHPDRGNDASHRGGPPGFVRTEGRTLWWPDYPGNNMFTSLGNLAVDDEAALLFLDFDRRLALHLNGTASLAEVPVGAPGDDGRTGRRVVFTVERIARSRLTVGSELLDPSPHNPPVGD